MVRILIISIVSIMIVFSASCKKDFGSYQEVPTVPDTTTTKQDTYIDGGVLTNNPDGNTNNELVGTKWVLTKMVSGLATTFPNDTLNFTDNNHYSMNGGASRTYTLTTITGSTNKSLTLNFFAPFSGSNYVGTVGQYFVSDAQISNAEFDDLQNSSTIIKAWFTKI